MLPVSEVTATQLRPGPALTNLTIFASSNIAILGAQHHSASVGVVILKPEYLGFMWWEGAEPCRINGEQAHRSAIYLQGTQNGFYATGGSRWTMGICVRRKDMIRTIAALNGVYPEDIFFEGNVLELSPEIANRFRTGMNRFVRGAIGSGSGAGVADPSEAIFGMLVEVLLSPWNGRQQSGRALHPEHIVRQAEEQFFESPNGQISLADLCAATRVSKSTLYRAFDSVCGESPLAYFHKRRLTSARRMLLNSTPYRGAIRHAALTNGFTEFGRFSLEYRHFFGESPSTTLTSKQHL